MLRVEVGKLIRLHRQRAGLSQQALADAIGRSIQLIGKAERGAGAPSYDVLDAIAGKLGVAPRDLFPGDVKHSDHETARVVGLMALLTPEERTRVRKVVEAMLKG